MADHRCPVWVGYLMANPIRKLRQSPARILNGLISPGMTVLDLGCAMGFFSLPMARMAGANGRVICADVQQKMLDALERRARRRGFSDRILLHRCQDASIGLPDFGRQVDFALAFAVIHEVTDPRTYFQELYDLLKNGGRLLFAEPTGHVDPSSFQASLELATSAGFSSVDSPAISWSRAALLEKTSG